MMNNDNGINFVGAKKVEDDNNIKYIKIEQCDCGGMDKKEVKNEKDLKLADYVIKKDNIVRGIFFKSSCYKCTDEKILTDKWEKKYRILNDLYMKENKY